MKPSKAFSFILPFFAMAVPFAYIYMIWDRLPQTIPTHFGISGQADSWGPRSEIFLAPLIFSVMGTAVYFLIRNVHRIDPKKKYTDSNIEVMNKISVMMLVFLCALSLVIIQSTLTGKLFSGNLILTLVALFFAFMGNIMHSLKPNYFVGIRLPWTLENEDNWRQTHQKASKIWMAGGLLLAALSFFIPQKPFLAVFFAGTIIIVLIPVIFSYRLYKKNQSDK